MNNFRIKFTTEISEGIPFDTDIIVQLIKNKIDNKSIEIIICKGLTYEDIETKVNEISIKLNEGSDERYNFYRDNICFGESIKNFLTRNGQNASKEVAQTIIYIDYYLSKLEITE